MVKGTKMRSILFSLFLLLFSSYTLSAQYYGNDYGGLVGGLFGGVTTAQINGDGFKGYDKWGYTGGGFLLLPIQDAGLPFAGTLAYSIGVQFTQKGAIGSDPRNGIARQKIDLNYAEVPVMIHYYRGPRKTNIGMGLAIGYIAWEETSIDRGDGFGYQRVENHYKKFDLSFVLNPNFHIWKGIYLSPKFQYSLLNIKNKKAPSVGRTEQYSDLLSLSVMYIFGGER